MKNEARIIDTYVKMVTKMEYRPPVRIAALNISRFREIPLKDVTGMLDRWIKAHPREAKTVFYGLD